MLATPLAAAERPQASKEHDNGNGFLSPVFGIARAALASKFDNAPLFVGHEGTLVPAKQWPCSERRRARGSPCTTGRVKTTRSRARGYTRGLEDAHFTADARAVLESEQEEEEEHAALEKERKHTAGILSPSDVPRAGS